MDKDRNVVNKPQCDVEFPSVKLRIFAGKTKRTAKNF